MIGPELAPENLFKCFGTVVAHEDAIAVSAFAWLCLRAKSAAEF